MAIETYLPYLAALAACFATPPDSSRLLIIANRARHGLNKSGWTIAGGVTVLVVGRKEDGRACREVLVETAMERRPTDRRVRTYGRDDTRRGMVESGPE